MSAKDEETGGPMPPNAEDACHLWCVDCGVRLTKAEVIGWGCPKCGCKGVPCAPDKDLRAEINWHELHILCCWAEAWASHCAGKPGADDSSAGMPRTVLAIAGRLEGQFPSFNPLTLGREIQELPQAMAERGIEIGDVETNAPLPKPFMSIGPGAVGHSNETFPVENRARKGDYPELNRTKPHWLRRLRQAGVLLSVLCPVLAYAPAALAVIVVPPQGKKSEVVGVAYMRVVLPCIAAPIASAEPIDVIDEADQQYDSTTFGGIHIRDWDGQLRFDIDRLGFGQEGRRPTVGAAFDGVRLNRNRTCVSVVHQSKRYCRHGPRCLSVICYLDVQSSNIPIPHTHDLVQSGRVVRYFDVGAICDAGVFLRISDQVLGGGPQARRIEGKTNSSDSNQEFKDVIVRGEVPSGSGILEKLVNVAAVIGLLVACIALIGVAGHLNARGIVMGPHNKKPKRRQVN